MGCYDEHNHLLQAALDLGLPGLTAYLAMWLLAVAMTIQVWRSGAPAGLFAHFVYGNTDLVALGAKPGIFWWWLLALMSANLAAGPMWYNRTRRT